MVRKFDINIDYKEVKGILDKSFNSAVSFKAKDKGFGNRQMYVLEAHGRIVATATLIIVDKFIDDSGCMAIIEDVATAMNSRSKGYASHIVKKLVYESKVLDCYKIILNCSDGLVPFYERNGFKKDGSLMLIDLE